MDALDRELYSGYSIADDLPWWRLLHNPRQCAVRFFGPDATLKPVKIRAPLSRVSSLLLVRGSHFYLYLDGEVWISPQDARDVLQRFRQAVEYAMAYVEESPPDLGGSEM